jgi:hypothetical protein
MPTASTNQDTTSQLDDDEGEGDMNNIRDKIANACLLGECNFIYIYFIVDKKMYELT